LARINKREIRVKFVKFIGRIVYGRAGFSAVGTVFAIHRISATLYRYRVFRETLIIVLNNCYGVRIIAGRKGARETRTASEFARRLNSPTTLETRHLLFFYDDRTTLTRAWRTGSRKGKIEYLFLEVFLFIVCKTIKKKTAIRPCVCEKNDFPMLPIINYIIKVFASEIRDKLFHSQYFV